MTTGPMGFAVLLALLTTYGESASVGSQLKPIHLRGITGVNVIVFVDRKVEGFTSVESKLRQQVNTLLSQNGLIPASRSDLTLSIAATLYPTDLTKADVSLLGVQVVLREPVQLGRDPTLKILGGNGAITWSKEWSTLALTTNLPSAIDREVVSMVRDFAADVTIANK